MKQCLECQGLELYDDVEMYCPHCNAVLVPYVRNNRRQSAGMVNNEPIRPRMQNQTEKYAEAPVFESYSGGRLVYRGTVVSITPTSRFMTRFMKWFNAIFRGQPYQFGNPVYETVIRIEEISRLRIPDQMRSIVYYGEPGELNVGDDITVSAVRRTGRLVARDLVINDIESVIRPYNQISALAVRILSLMAVLFFIFLTATVVLFFYIRRHLDIIEYVHGRHLETCE